MPGETMMCAPHVAAVSADWSDASVFTVTGAAVGVGYVGCQQLVGRSAGLVIVGKFDVAAEHKLGALPGPLLPAGGPAGPGGPIGPCGPAWPCGQSSQSRDRKSV